LAPQLGGAAKYTYCLLQQLSSADGLGHFQVTALTPQAKLFDDHHRRVFATGRSIFRYHTETLTWRATKPSAGIPRGFVEVKREDASKAEHHTP